MHERDCTDANANANANANGNGNETVIHDGREVIFFASPAALRAWLDEHSTTSRELFVGFWKVGSGRQTLNWQQTVDEALCVGWIDSTQRRLDDQRHYIRLTPRRRNSVWSAVNVRRVPELAAEGRMTPAGLAVFTERHPSQTEGYTTSTHDAELTPELLALLQADGRAWAFFEAQPPGYQRNSRWWIMQAKRDETRLKRVEMLREAAAAGRRLHQVTGQAKDRPA